MTVSKAIIDHLMKIWDRDSEKIAGQLAEYDRIDKVRRSILIQREKAKESLKARLADFDKEDAANQQNCDHPDPSFHGDPAGGNDSFHQCPICGVTW